MKKTAPLDGYMIAIALGNKSIDSNLANMMHANVQSRLYLNKFFILLIII
jgi:hypothetical protein